MKKITAIMVTLAITILAHDALAKKSKIYMAKYQPVAGFMEEDSALGQLYKQYVDTTSGDKNFKGFLKRLSTSDVLAQRSQRVGLTYEQLYAPMNKLLNSDMNDPKATNEEIKATMLELDVAVAAINATIPANARKIVWNEVIKNSPTMNAMAMNTAKKAPTLSAIDAMSISLSGRKVSDRINSMEVPKSDNLPQVNPMFVNPYAPW